MLHLLSEFIKYKDNVVKLAEFYYEHAAILMELKGRFPNWENYVNQYLSAEVRAGLRKRRPPIKDALVFSAPSTQNKILLQ